MKMKERDSEINNILKEQQKLNHRLTELNLEKKRMDNEVIVHSESLLLVMLMGHGWSYVFIFCY